MIGWTAVVVAVGAAIVLLLKRYTAFGRQLNGGGAIRVVGRTALSPKHSIFLVRLGNQRLLAVCSEWSDTAPLPMNVDATGKR